MSSHASNDIEMSTNSTVTQSRPTSSAQPGPIVTLPPTVQTASQILLEAPPRTPYRLMGEGSSASVDALAEHMSVQAAISLTKPSVPPFLSTPWEHTLHWSMPPHAILADIFPPVLVDAIRNAYIEHNTRCFCAVVITTAQQLLRTLSSRNLLREHPTDMADCLSVMNQVMLAKGVKVFTIECDRIESIYGRIPLDEHISRRTFAEHMSEFIEQLPRMGYAAYQAAEAQLEVEAGDAKKDRRVKRCTKKALKRFCERLRLKKRDGHGQDSHSSLVAAPQQAQVQERSRRSSWISMIWEGKASRVRVTSGRNLDLDEVGRCGLMHLLRLVLTIVVISRVVDLAKDIVV